MIKYNQIPLLYFHRERKLTVKMETKNIYLFLVIITIRLIILKIPIVVIGYPGIKKIKK